MTQEDKKEIKRLKKLVEAKMWLIEQFNSSPMLKDICKDVIDNYNKIIKILKKYIKNTATCELQ